MIKNRFFEALEKPLRFTGIGEHITADSVYTVMESLKQEHETRDKRIKICYNVLCRKNPVWDLKEILQEIADCTGWKYGTIKKIVKKVKK